MDRVIVFENKELFYGYSVMIIGVILTVIAASIIVNISSMNSNSIFTSILIISGFLISGFIGGLLAKNYYLKAVRNTFFIEYGLLALIGLLAVMNAEKQDAQNNNCSYLLGCIHFGTEFFIFVYIFFLLIVFVVTILTSICLLLSSYVGHSVVSKKIKTT